jgi:hypothetical protein
VKLRKLNSPWHLRKANRSVDGLETIVCVDQPISSGLSRQGPLIEAMQKRLEQKTTEMYQ